MKLAAFLFNKGCTIGDTLRDKDLSTPENIERFDGIRYGKDKKWNKLDVYRPKEAKGEKFPVILNVHGGGWVYGTTVTYQYYCMSLAQQDFAVVSYNYHLAPKYKFPLPLVETNEVVTWIFEHADEYGFDTSNIFGVGDSAGGHLLGLYAAICAEPDFAKEYGITPPEGMKFTAVGLNCGAYDVDLKKKTNALNILIHDTIEDHDYDKWQPYMNVLERVTPNFPPAYVMTATGDFLQKEAPKLTAKLEENGVPFVYKMYGMENGKKVSTLMHVFHCDIHKPEARQCNKDECDFFQTHLR